MLYCTALWSHHTNTWHVYFSNYPFHRFVFVRRAFWDVSRICWWISSGASSGWPLLHWWGMLSGYKLNGRGGGKRACNREFYGVLWCEQSAPTWRVWAENPWPLHTPFRNSHGAAVDQSFWFRMSEDEACASPSAWGLNTTQPRASVVIKVSLLCLIT